ncbi:MAG: hypothetical protein R2824_25105 [Saprospiraceae bacterium]|nr:hypothetical protein [Lewinella sp.]
MNHSIKRTWPVGILLIVLLVSACRKSETTFRFDFNEINDRTWIGEDFWATPLENWRVRNSRVEYLATNPLAIQNKVHLLTRVLDQAGELDIRVNAGWDHLGTADDQIGLAIGVRDTLDDDPRAAVYYGEGLAMGIQRKGTFFLGEQSQPLPEDFDQEDFQLSLTVRQSVGEEYRLSATVSGKNGSSASLTATFDSDLSGLINLFCTNNGRDSTLTAWFDDLDIQGTKVVEKDENRFGPILWTMYTTSREVLRLNAQFPPLGQQDNQQIQLQIRSDNKWTTISENTLDPASWTGLFEVSPWTPDADTEYRVVYEARRKTSQTTTPHYYRGIIRIEPDPGELSLAGLTCQHGYAYPYSPLRGQLADSDPDLLFFSGDQIYEPNGGYPVVRFPARAAVLDYLGKWYMFGWAFGEVMKDRPTICTPDDHDVFQGNLWGDGGRKIPQSEWNRWLGVKGGYIEPAEMINVVHRTQSGHLPKPSDPEPIEQGITAWYTDLVYAGVGFGIISDRMFKSGPYAVNGEAKRADHLTEPVADPKVFDRPGLRLIGDRQLDFLRNWITDWRDTKMKVLLSQSLFANPATHHGDERMVLAADFDSGGWPQTRRDEVLKILRKGFVFHLTGDQHLGTIVQYGINEYADAGWVFSTPAIATHYRRAFEPDKLGFPVLNRPAHQLPNTGYYTDGFGNKNFVYAVGNPDEVTNETNRYEKAQSKASGFGFLRFDVNKRVIHMDAFRFGRGKTFESFPGWPFSISQFDNYPMEKAGEYLPHLEIRGLEEPVLRVKAVNRPEPEYIIRLPDGTYTPRVFIHGRYEVRVGDPETGRWQSFTDLPSQTDAPADTLIIEF